jgi:RecB family exonuclease
MYKRCPWQYKLRYIDGIKMKPKSQKILGTGVHRGLEEGFREKKINGGDDIKIKNIMKDKTVVTIEELAKSEDVEWSEGDNIDVIKDDGAKMVSVYYDEKGKKIKPVEVEKEFEISFENLDWKLKGKIDLITNKKIIDYKTGAAKPSDEWILYDDQLKIYRIVENLPVESHWIVRYKHKDPQIYIYRKIIGEVETKQTLQDIAVVVKLIRTGYFYKKNDIKTCGWCGYKEICQK